VAFGKKGGIRDMEEILGENKIAITRRRGKGGEDENETACFRETKVMKKKRRKFCMT